MRKYMNDNFSPAFSSFRGLMDLWDHHCALQEQEDRLNDILDKHEIILFFNKDKELFGAPEDSRVIFAKLKTDDDDEPMMLNFRQEAQFPAINLFKCLNSNDDESSVQSVFGLKDLPKIKVCDRESAVKQMMKHATKKSNKK